LKKGQIKTGVPIDKSPRLQKLKNKYNNERKEQVLPKKEIQEMMKPAQEKADVNQYQEK